jgi:peptidoglycan hydrolase-like protein with peptidoglycan-binding domain/lysophospholipase L1-like esterase
MSKNISKKSAERERERVVNSSLEVFTNKYMNRTLKLFGRFFVFAIAITIFTFSNTHTYAETTPVVTPVISTTSSISKTNTIRVLKLQIPRMKGDDVKTLQTLLNKLGYNTGTPDGYFGPKTEAGVKLFQKANKLTADGKAGKNTLSLINNPSLGSSGPSVSQLTAGCASGALFNTITGKSCSTTQQPTVLPAGCSSTIGFSTTLGVSCSTGLPPTPIIKYSGGGSTGPSIYKVSNPTISGVTIPAQGETPVSTLASTSEYTATIAWTGSPATFLASTLYTATITLTPKSNYTLTGVSANFFTVAGATATNTADTGVITAVFPATPLKQLTISLPTITTSKSYNGNTTAVVTAGTLAGVTSGETVTVSATATYDNKNIGTGKTITVIYTLGGADASHYIKPADYIVSTGIIFKADVSTPSAPTLASKTDTSITLVSNALNEFSIDSGSTWQSSEVFTSLTPITSYTFVTRVKETSTTNASPSSVASASITTDAPPADAPNGDPSLLTLTVISGTQINLAWTIGSTNQDGHSIERSTDGVNFTEIATVTAGISSYSNSGLTASATYFYRVRAFKGINYSGYSNINSNYYFGLVPQGSANGKQILEIQTTEDITLKFDGTGRFYDDAGCTTNPTTTKTVVAGSLRTIYWKSPTVADKLRFSDTTKVTKITKMAGEYYSPIFTIDLSYFRNITQFKFAPETVTYTSVYGTVTGSITNLPLTYLNITATSTITGDITGKSFTYFHSGGAVTGSIANSTGITHLYCAGNISGSLDSMTSLNYLYLSGTSNTVSGSLSNKTALTFLDIFGSTLTADVTNLVNLTRINVMSTGSNLTGSITNITNLNYIREEYTNALTGSVTNLTGLTYLNVLGGNTISGTLDNIVNLELCQASGHSTITYNNLTNLTKLSYISLSSYVTLSEVQVNQALADFWLNRDVAKPQAGYRAINLMAGVTTSSPTGQGLVDAANLAAYKTPNNTGPAFWTVTVRGNMVSFVGTSITAGTGASPSSNRYSTVFSVLDNDTENNVGMSGRRLHGTGGLKETAMTDIPTASNSSKYLIIEIGANDTDWETYGGSVFQSDLDYVVKVAINYKSWTANRIKLLTTFNTSMNWSGLITYYNTVGTANGVQVIDTGTQLYNGGNYAGNMADIVHPNNTGHAIMANYIDANITL